MFTPIPRADRISFPIPIMYRRMGEPDWFPSKVVNLSDSGVLFGPTQIEPGTPVEIILSPPIQLGWIALGKQVCAAKVVRSMENGAVAARFDGSRFLLDG